MAPPGRLLDLAVVVPRAVGHDGPGTEGVVAPVFGRRLRCSHLAHRGPLLQQELFQHEREVVHEVPAVGDLHGLGGALGQGFAVDVRAVPRGGLYLGVPFQPSDEAFLRAFGEQVHHSVAWGPAQAYLAGPGL